MLEALIVVGLGGALLTAISLLLFGILELTHQLRTQPHFDQHVEGVSRFLNTVFADANQSSGGNIVSRGGPSGDDDDDDDDESSSANPDNPQVNPFASEGDAGVNWAMLPGGGIGQKPVLSVAIHESLPLFHDAKHPTPSQVSAYVTYEPQQGLVLVWQSDAVREDDVSGYRQILLSAMVTEMAYLFYDERNESWERVTSEETVDQRLGLPDFLELTFVATDARTVVRRILLPSDTLAPPMP